MKPVWIVNTLHPEKMNSEAMASPEMGADRSDAVWQKWLADKALGEPQPTDGLSVDDLKAQGYVGVYKYVWG
ncbi:hypothetical protein [Altericista sp. CCNU0014]|uniref:hypothetical protein n=1 Tax=Altericista sp. CCNU0014 TaxID=3082949 RepID=UPI003851680C